MRVPIAIFACAALLLSTASARGQVDDHFEFTRMIAHWANYAHPDYLAFVDEAEPEVVQLGFYGGHFWSLAHTPQYGGYPAHFPVRGLSECGDWFREKNQALRNRGIKTIGHFNVEFLVGDPNGPEGPRGFFRFYRELWDKDLLGPRPVEDPLDLLERDASGEPLVNDNYSIGGMKEYWACLRNPHWRQVLKAWVKVGVDRGLDGFIANYFYRHDCHCKYCRQDFRDYLRRRFSADELRRRFSISDLQQHTFPELVAWHPPTQSTPLRREMLRWSQISNKRAFDEVFVQYGRQLKPDLIVAQWNHLGDFNQINGDERCLLPAELWGADEDYLWYSTGGAANYTDLANGFLGDATLQARYIRGAFDDKPFTLGKYEITRIRAAIAELAANGGAPMGFYTRFTDPLARKTIARYYQFLKRNDGLYRGNRSHAEVLLLFPRRAIHERGDVAQVAKFKEIGKRLLDEHVLFDVLPDDRFDQETRRRYAVVLSTTQSAIDPEVESELSRFTAPPTVRVSVSRPAAGGELTLHLVNYDREEPAKRNGRPSPGGGISDEKPRSTENIDVDLALPANASVTQVSWLNPEASHPEPLSWSVRDGRLQFRVPRLFVYGVARIQLQSNQR